LISKNDDLRGFWKFLFVIYKIKVFPVHVRKAHRGSEGIPPPVLNPALDRDGDCFTPQPLYLPSKGAWYPQNKRPGGLHGWSGRFAECHVSSVRNRTNIPRTISPSVPSHCSSRPPLLVAKKASDTKC